MKLILIVTMLVAGVVLSGYSASKGENHFQSIYYHGSVGTYGIYNVTLQDNTYCVAYSRNGIQCDFSERIK